MPNLVAHFGVGGVITRPLAGDACGAWIFTGCVIPDVPWIVQRAVFALPVDVNPYEMRLYAVAQASLAGCLVLAMALAALAYAPGRIFGVLAVNSLLHLVLDAFQTKWANGVHLFAPLSWNIWNVGLFWPESYTTVLLTAFGLVYFCVAWRREWRSPVGRSFPSARRVAVFALLLAVYFTLPYLLLDGARSADSHFVHTLQAVQERKGRYIELDRNRYFDAEEGGVVKTFAGEEIRMIGAAPDRSGKLSLRGRFVDSFTIYVEEFHEHWTSLRDWASMLGLTLIAAWWLSVWLHFFAQQPARGLASRRFGSSPAGSGNA